MRVIAKEPGKYLLRFDRGEELVSGLAEFVKEERIGAASLSAIGAANEIVVCFYNGREKHYEEHLIKERLEIVSLLGTIAWKGEIPTVHAHGSFSKSNLHAVAGHIARCVIAQTCEAAVFVFRKKAKRVYDKATGLNLLE